jgi:hypothetical protein
LILERREARGLSEGALEAPGGFLQLTLERVDLLGNVGELFLGKHAGLGDLMGFAIGATHGGADFDRDSREFGFPSHCVLQLQRLHGTAGRGSCQEEGCCGGGRRNVEKSRKGHSQEWLCHKRQGGTRDGLKPAPTRKAAFGRLAGECRAGRRSVEIDAAQRAAITKKQKEAGKAKMAR